MVKDKSNLPSQVGKGIVYPKVKLRDVIKAFWNGIRPKKWQLFILLASIILGNIATIIIPLYYTQFFDIIAVGGDKTTNREFSCSSRIIFIIYKTNNYWR